MIVVPFRARDVTGEVRLEGMIELDLDLTPHVPFDIDGLFIVGSIGQVTIKPVDVSAVPLDVFSGANHLFEIQTDGSLHGKTGQSLAFDL